MSTLVCTRSAATISMVLCQDLFIIVLELSLKAKDTLGSLFCPLYTAGGGTRRQERPEPLYSAEQEKGGHALHSIHDSRKELYIENRKN